MTKDMKQKAYREAAAILVERMGMVDMPPELTFEQQEEVREFIRTEIAGDLDAKGRARRATRGRR